MRDLFGVGYRLDPVAQHVQDTVNDALRYPFRFHGVNKVVMWLGPSDNARDYIEMAGVGEKRWTDFSVEKYLELGAAEREEMLWQSVRRTFDWFESEFVDSNFVAVGRRNLGWGS